MRKLLAYSLAVLLFTVAFAGLSPPTQKQNKQNVIASTSHVQPVVAVEARGVPAPVSNNKEKTICAYSANSVVGANPVDGKNEVAARARNGVSEAAARSEKHPPDMPVGSDVATVLLL